jgi:dTDP-glucose 4,6-dehydratase
MRERLEVVASDLRDAERVRAAVSGCEVVFHLGALIAIPYSYVSPRDVVETNVLGTLNVLLACREEKIARLVHTSTSEVYGTAQTVPIGEDHPLVGQSPYSASKIAADQIAESFHRSYGLPVTTVRPFNTYGPRQSARAVIPTIITQAMTDGRVFLGALHPTRDLCYVQDTVRGFLAMAQADGAVGRVTNLGTGVETSVRELVDKVGGVLGRKVEVVFDATRLRPGPSEVDRLLADPRRAAELAGWRAEVTVDEGLRRTVAWISEHFHMYRPAEYAI